LSAQTRRRRRNGLDIWPGFVDALATLVMVIVFVLMIFTLFQFHLKDLLTGRDLALERMSQRIGDLADQLAVERRRGADLRDQVGRLGAELAATMSLRDRLRAELDSALARAAELGAELNDTRTRADLLGTQLAARDAEARSLAGRLGQAENDLVLTRREIEGLLQRLAETQTRLAETQTRLADTDRRAMAGESRVLGLTRQLSDTETRLRDAEARAMTAEAAAAELSRRLAAIETRAVAAESGAAALERRLAAGEALLQDTRTRAAASEASAADLARRLEAAQAALREADSRATTAAAAAADLTRRLQAAEAALKDFEGRIAIADRQAADLVRRLALAEAASRDAESRATAGAASTTDLARRLQAAETALRDAQGRITLGEREAAELVRRLAAADARSREADARLAEAVASVRADRERIEVQLRELDALRDNIRILTVLRDQLQRDIAARDAALQGSQAALAGERRLTSDAQLRIDLLTREIETLRQQLGRLETALEASEAKSREQDVQIVDLGRRLNLALASKIEELARYRSEFFGRLREVLGDRGDVRVVGDRFIFETEILFRSGSAELEPEGRRQIDRVANELAKLADRIPGDINWILQVDGHTDRRPIARSFPSNWELSHARAMSVVRAMIAGGVPPERLVAAGYAEFQPVDPRDDEAAYRRNRRIELKLTAR
jgi:chemotaxis protein MotB